jgi:hypothetical protein
MRHLFLAPVIRNAINDVVDKNGYDRNTHSTTYTLPFDYWTTQYAITSYCWKHHLDQGLLVDEYPSITDLLHVYVDDIKVPKRITALYIDNVSGWNNDTRSTGKEDKKDYKDYYRVSKQHGITLHDIIDGVFSVKSGKCDDNYELFANVKTNVERNVKGNLELNLVLEFDHGS